MRVDIQNLDDETIITFTQKDLTDIDDVISICNAIASGKYCFEANALSSESFETFIKNLQPRRTYFVAVGRAYNKSFVEWGVLKRTKAT